MKDHILVNRYAKGLVNAIQDQEEYAMIERELLEFAGLLRDHQSLKDVLESPLLSSNKKVQIVKGVLTVQAFGAKTSRFILLLLDHNRLHLFNELLDGLPVLWNEKRGIYTFEVSSVIPLKETQKRRLEKELERLEKNPVRLTYAIDPLLIGGLRVKKGNFVYDISLKGHLLKLKEKISEG